ncbi:hypothetical protein VRRI112168_02620 [Vreelandella rituensis]|uniref:DUF202 domain-containing protein n=1 Tax=Vreelandella rituensis TaxID=2282306 RepID=A0A368U8X0_9GAMM|nr:hypothetical protein [Halomonas rituensis]RCV93638.1 hypothetical protein DU506_00340 [Halomonas rituensis]
MDDHQRSEQIAEIHRCFSLSRANLREMRKTPYIAGVFSLILLGTSLLLSMKAIPVSAGLAIVIGAILPMGIVFTNFFTRSRQCRKAHKRALLITEELGIDQGAEDSRAGRD